MVIVSLTFDKRDPYVEYNVVVDWFASGSGGQPLYKIKSLLTYFFTYKLLITKQLAIKDLFPLAT